MKRTQTLPQPDSELKTEMNEMNVTLEAVETLIDVVDDSLYEAGHEEPSKRGRLQLLLKLAKEKISDVFRHSEKCFALESLDREVDRRALVHPEIVDKEARNLQSAISDFDDKVIATIKRLLDASRESQELIWFWLEGKLESERAIVAKQPVAHRIVRRPKKTAA